MITRSSWTTSPSRHFRSTIMRRAAAKFADKKYERTDPQWQQCFWDFMSGWLACAKQRNATIKVKLKPLA